MPNYLSPGVYVEEVSSGAKPIAGVGTSVGAFIGLTEKGSNGKPALVTNWSQFTNEFGGFIPNAYLPYAVYNFFAEGGTSCYIVRIKPDDAVISNYTVKEDSENPVDLLKITARSHGYWGDRISFVISDATNAVKDDQSKFKLTIKYKESFDDDYAGEKPEGELVEIFDNLLLRDIEEKVNDVSAFVNVEVLVDKQNVDDMLKIIKRNAGKDEQISLKEGNDGKQVGKEYLDTEKGINAFDIIDEINIVAAPDIADLKGSRDLIISMLNYCRLRGDCFFVADAPHGLTASQVKDFKEGTGDYMGSNALNSSYGALYYPWVYINDPLTGKRKLVPPSGAIIGTYAYVDSTRGVHKAPAGTTDGYLDTAVGIERIITKGEQEILNPLGINVIRSLPEGICVWGARTLSADTEWQYINIRRLMMYIEESVDKGSQWVVFEPNEPSLWGKVKRNLSAFLTRVWRDGALYGSTQEEAFFIKVDEENNPPATRDAGQLIIEVGIAPVKPAEFVIIRVSQKTLAK